MCVGERRPICGPRPRPQRELSGRSSGGGDQRRKGAERRPIDGARQLRPRAPLVVISEAVAHGPGARAPIQRCVLGAQGGPETTSPEPRSSPSWRKEPSRTARRVEAMRGQRISGGVRASTSMSTPLPMGSDLDILLPLSEGAVCLLNHNRSPLRTRVREDTFGSSGRFEAAPSDPPPPLMTPRGQRDLPRAATRGPLSLWIADTGARSPAKDPSDANREPGGLQRGGGRE